MATTDPLRREHKHLLAGIEHLRVTGDGVGRASTAAIIGEVEAAVSFLHGHLMPHARSEDEVLYPAIGRLLGSARATRTMTRDHVEVERLAGQLERAVEEYDEAMLRRVLYGLYHVLKLHLAKEEEIFFPLLDEELPPDQAEELLTQLHAA